MNTSVTAVAALALSALSVGCVTLFSKTEVLRGDERRVPVRYESARAAEAFRNGMDRQSNNHGATSLSVPFVTFYERRKILSPDAFFNQQVGICDADQDGVITELEAQAYSGERFVPPTGWPTREPPFKAAPEPVNW